MMLVPAAFGVEPNQVQMSGMPGWVNSDKFDIEAKMDSSVAEDLRKLGERLASDGEARAQLLDPRATVAVKKAAAEKLLPASARPLARDFAAMAVHLLGAIGFFRCPSEDGPTLYLAVHEPE